MGTPAVCHADQPLSNTWTYLVFVAREGKRELFAQVAGIPVAVG
jgi:hypothetical protein